MTKKTRQFIWLLCLSLGLIKAASAHAEAFGNTALSIPRVGFAFFDVPFMTHSRPWGLAHQWTVGTSFMQAINYKWWWIIDSHMGFGNLTVDDKPFVASFAGGAGLRFNVFEEDFRPHTTLMVHYLQFIGDGQRAMPLNMGWPIFVGVRPLIGLEWLIFSEMALAFDGSYGFYVNINEPFRHVWYTSASFMVYF